MPVDTEDPRETTGSETTDDESPAAAPEASVPAGSGSPAAAAGLSPAAGSVDDLMGAAAAAAPTPAAETRPDLADLKAIIEALVFASPDPLTPKALFRLLEHELQPDVEAALAALRADYHGHGGLQFVEVAGGFQIVTRPELHEWVRRLFHERRAQKLSVQALETLAVIAYKQPITAPEIAEIRGVNTTGVLATLLERHLIKISGRKLVVGRPFLYATTREFLIRFGLRDLNDLPKVEDMADVLGFDLPTRLAAAGPVDARLPLEPEESGAEEPDHDDEETGAVH